MAPPLVRGGRRRRQAGRFRGRHRDVAFNRAASAGVSPLSAQLPRELQRTESRADFQRRAALDGSPSVSRRYTIYIVYIVSAPTSGQLQHFKRGLRQLDVDVDDLVIADIRADIRVLREDLAQLLFF